MPNRSSRCSAALVLTAIISLLITSCILKKAPKADLIPLDLFFGNLERTSPQLSPDGKKLAYLAPRDSVMNIWIKTPGQDDDYALTQERERDLREFYWTPNSEQILYRQDKNGDENWHIYRVTVVSGLVVDLTPLEGVQARIISVEPNVPEEILIGLNEGESSLHDIYRLNLNTGAITLEYQNDLKIVDWIADHNLQLRIAQTTTPDGGFTLLHRPDSSSSWQHLTHWGHEDGMSTQAYGFGGDNRTLYIVSSVGANTSQLRTWDVLTNAETLVAGDSTYDLSEVIMQPRSYKPQAVLFAQDQSDWVALDTTITADLQALRTLHRGKFNVLSRDLEDKTWLVMYEVDDSPIVYYTYDTAADSGTYLFSQQSKLEGKPLVQLEPVAFNSRDGLEIRGLMALPLNTKAKNLPAVIFVHDGPWSRESWSYIPVAQWLANRGYAFLTVNFRGSTGYGKHFINAGDREWGGKMQDDVTDATQWLVSQGIADSQRIAIMGGSYGGFATLSGVSKEPDRYVCGVDYFGPSNLITFLKAVPAYMEPLKPMLYKRIGDPAADSALLAERSPINHIAPIKAPLLIAQGVLDPRVPVTEGRQMRDSLQAANKTYTYMEFPDEGHLFVKSTNRLKFYSAVEQFLGQYLGGRVDTLKYAR